MQPGVYPKTISVVVGLLLMAAMASASAQTTLNPDISVVGDFRGFIHNDELRAIDSEELRLADPGLELYISGYLNPYASAAMNLAWHGEHSAEIEELYGTILRGLPFGMNLRVGKYLLEFGRLNTVHPHAYSFLHRPLVHESFFGEEGLNDVAVRGSFMIPTGSAFTEVMIAALQGDLLFSHHHEETEHEEEEVEAEPGLGVFGRLTTSIPTGEFSEFAVGGSVASAIYAFEHDELDAGSDPEQLRATLLGGDAKFKYRPDRYTALQIEAEAVVRIEELPDGNHLNSYGGYGYLDYRFRQKYNAGGIVEWLRRRQHVHAETEAVESLGRITSADADHTLSADTWRLGIFAGFAPIEETSLVRLVANWTEPDGADGYWELTLQFLFSLGPHKPHNF